MVYRIYLSASTQENNKGVGSYGTEEAQMFILRDLTEKYLKAGKYGAHFMIKKNTNKASELSEIVKASNAFKADSHWAFHTNAGDKAARGCESYYHKVKAQGYKMAKLWYDEVSLITPTSDRGVKADTTVYKNGFYELRETIAPAALMEFIFHTNLSDVAFFLANIEKFALATAKAIYSYYGYSYSVQSESEMTPDLNWMFEKGLINNKNYSNKTYFNSDQIAIILHRFYDLIKK